MVAFALLLAVPLSAQAPAGLQMRLDKSTNANDPDDVPDVKITTVANGFQVVTGPAVVAWNPANTASGAYTLKGTFTLLAPSGHTNYYGLVFGGGDLAGPMQNYLYFLIAQNGTFIVKHRGSDSEADIMDVVGRTEHAAIVRPDASGKSVNALEVRVGASDIAFVVNGTVVHTAPKTGMTAKTDGIWGVRVNHVIPGVVVEGLSVTR
jgi:hypothetical protein